MTSPIIHVLAYNCQLSFAMCMYKLDTDSEEDHISSERAAELPMAKPRLIF
jgi:hypothetical protein